MNYKVGDDVKEWIISESKKLDDRTPGWFLDNFVRKHWKKDKAKKPASTDMTSAWQMPAGLNPKAWAEFDQHRKKHKSAWSDLAKTKSANVLLALSHEEQQATVDKSVQAGWPGLYPEKAKDNKSFIEKQNDSTFEQLFGKDEGVIEGECDVRE